MGTEWKPVGQPTNVFEGRDRKTGELEVDRHPRRPGLRLQLRSCAPWPKSTRSSDAQEKFVHDFVAAWTKVMNLDRFDLA